jgi:hypothetical protein
VNYLDSTRSKMHRDGTTRRGKKLRLLSAALGLAMAAVMASPAGAASAGPRVIPPQSKPFGATYARWDARWWRWFYQTPVNINPEFSAAGTPDAPAAVDCSAGQRNGNVWFLGGTFLPTTTGPQVSRSDVYRTCSIPAGTFLFFPLLNDEYDNLGCPNATFTAKQLTAAAKLGIDDIVPGSMSATIDGDSVPGLANGRSRYRSPSPWFSYALPADNVGQFFCGTSFPPGTKPPTVKGHPGATADGVYLMLAPLSPGTHVIHFGGELNVPSDPTPPPPAGSVDFIQNINYTITVTHR